nr:protein TIFY 7-like isoform X1 [Ipomoea batatas]
MEKKQRSKKCKKLIDLNKEFHPKIPSGVCTIAAKQKWQPFGPFPSVLPPPLAPPSTYSVPPPAKNLVFGDLQPFRGASPTTASDGAPAAIPLNYEDDSALKTLPLLPTSSCESPNTYVTADDAAEDGEISSTAMLKTATTTDLRIAIFTVFGLLC